MKQIAFGAALAALLAPLAATPSWAVDYLIGVEQSMTGPIGFVGVPVANGVRIAADQINASGMLGAGNRIVIDVQDTASDKTQALTLFSKFAGDPKVLAVVGPTSTVEALAVSPVANDRKIVMMATATSLEVLKPGPWSFKGTITPLQYMPPIAKYALEVGKVKRCAQVYDRQNESTAAQHVVFRDWVTQRGVTVVSEDGVLGSDTDFTAIATKIVAANVDCVQISTQGPVSANIIVQLRQAGLPATAKVFGSTSESAQQYLQIAGKAAEGVIFGADFAPGGMNDAGRAFVAEHRKRYNSDPDNYAAVGFTMMQLVASAIKSSGGNPTRESIRDALAATRNADVIVGDGKFSLDENRVPNYTMALMVYRDGKQLLAPQ